MTTEKMSFEEFMFRGMGPDPSDIDEHLNHTIDLLEGRKKIPIYGRPAGNFFDSDAKRRCSVLATLYLAKAGSLHVQIKAQKESIIGGQYHVRFCLHFKNVDELRAWLSDDSIRYRSFKRGLSKPQHACLNRAKLAMGARLAAVV